MKHIQATIYLIRSEMGSQCSLVCLLVVVFSLGKVLSGGDRVPRERILQQSFEFSGEVR